MNKAQDFETVAYHAGRVLRLTTTSNEGEYMDAPLSGEWAGMPTPSTVIEGIEHLMPRDSTEDARAWDEQTALDAFEQGYWEAYGDVPPYFA